MWCLLRCVALLMNGMDKMTPSCLHQNRCWTATQISYCSTSIIFHQYLMVRILWMRIDFWTRWKEDESGLNPYSPIVSFITDGEENESTLKVVTDAAGWPRFISIVHRRIRWERLSVQGNVLDRKCLSDDDWRQGKRRINLSTVLVDLSLCLVPISKSFAYWSADPADDRRLNFLVRSILLVNFNVLHCLFFVSRWHSSL